MKVKLKRSNNQKFSWNVYDVGLCPPGNILLNIMVQSSMPCSRVGKNNVMVVCVPNPPVDDKSPSSPVPLLIRVKTTEDADELHKTLEEKKS